MDEIQKAMLLTQIKKSGTVTGQPLRPQVPAADGKSGTSFDAILDNAEIQFSKHAEKRLQARRIDVSPMERAKLSDALTTLQKKGAKDSLVLMGDKAFIVNVPSKTVVTAIAKDQMKDQVFTNIDSTMVVDN